MVGKRRAYPSDLTDEQWAVVGPFLAAWKARHPSASGHQGRYELREIVNAIFYLNRTGCQWSYLPHDLPPTSATYYYFALWRDDGTDQTIHDLLRCQAREKAGRSEDPTAVVLDTQSIRAANHVPAATTGNAVAKRVPGRKRGLAVDTLGLIIAVVAVALLAPRAARVRRTHEQHGLPHYAAAAGLGQVTAAVAKPGPLCVLLIEHDRVDEARGRMAEIVAEVWPDPVRVRLEWIGALVECGRYEQAIAELRADPEVGSGYAVNAWPPC